MGSITWRGYYRAVLREAWRETMRLGREHLPVEAAMIVSPSVLLLLTLPNWAFPHPDGTAPENIFGALILGLAALGTTFLITFCWSLAWAPVNLVRVGEVAIQPDGDRFAAISLGLSEDAKVRLVGWEYALVRGQVRPGDFDTDTFNELHSANLVIVERAYLTLTPLGSSFTLWLKARTEDGVAERTQPRT